MLICDEIQEELQACKLKRKHKNIFKIMRCSIIFYIKSVHVYKYTCLHIKVYVSKAIDFVILRLVPVTLGVDFSY